jgi:hypothetical protein
MSDTIEQMVVKAENYQYQEAQSEPSLREAHESKVCHLAQRQAYQPE